MPAGVGDRLKYHRLHSGLRRWMTAPSSPSLRPRSTAATRLTVRPAAAQRSRGLLLRPADGPRFDEVARPGRRTAVDVHGVAGTKRWGGELVDEPVGGQPEAVGVDDDGL